jgi:NodT family efflux transporter outer membrane factor (OMF) lipoprotein
MMSRLHGVTWLLAGLLAGCSMVPALKSFQGEAPARFKEAPVAARTVGASPAAPGPDWWTVLQDPVLDGLQKQLMSGNQSLQALSAQNRQARAALVAAQASLWPSLNLNASVGRSANQLTAPKGTSYSVSAPLSWELDVWGRLDAQASAAQAGLQASQEDLASARLSLQTTLVQSYLSLRTAERQLSVLREAEAAYKRFLTLTQYRYQAGVVSASDVAQAQTQFKTTQAQRIEVGTQRAQLEHALAVLVGQSPSTLNMPALSAQALTVWPPAVPDLPPLIPATVLEKRPDIQAAKRRVEAANAQRGVARAAFFPNVTFAASAGYRNTDLATLLNASNQFWSVGPALALSLFDGGQRRAAQAQAEAVLDQTVATYRQTVLTSFQDIEDNLVAAVQLKDQAQAQQEALDAAQKNLAITQAQYQTGTLSALNLVLAQTTALNAQRTLIDLQTRRWQAHAKLMGSGLAF